jgi:hypothetical protein
VACGKWQAKKRLHGAIVRNAELAGVDRGYVVKVELTPDAKRQWK